jgi:glycine cleavage system H protein
MSEFPSELKFTRTHEWVRDEGKGVYTIGISDHAQSLLGDMVFIDLPEVGDTVDAGDECAVAESVKAASDIYSPLTGEIVVVNEDLETNPELVNKDPYGDGWLFQIVLSEPSDLDDLLDVDVYESSLEED